MGERGAGRVLQPRRPAGPGQQHQTASRQRGHDSRRDEPLDVLAIDTVGSSLLAGEDVVLRGCELGHNAQGVDRHAAIIAIIADSELTASGRTVPGAPAVRM